MADQNGLIPLLSGQINSEIPMCNARDLHAGLRIESRFNDWISRRIEEYGFVEGEDYYSSLSNRSDGKPGKQRTDYRLTLDMAKELAMIENNDIGRTVRRYFIQAEKELRQKIISDLGDKARHVLTLPGVKSLRCGISFKQTVVLQKQSRDLVRLIIESQSYPAQINMHRQLRQVNDALGIPTDPLSDITSGFSGSGG